jgi:lysophospholipase L1-like esterase
MRLSGFLPASSTREERRSSRARGQVVRLIAAVAGLACGLALAGQAAVTAGPTWTQTDAAKAGPVVANPLTGPGLQAASKELAALRSGLRAGPSLSGGGAAAPAALPSTVSRALEKFSSLLGGRHTSAPEVVHNPARLRKLLGAKKAAMAIADGDLVVTMSADDVEPSIVSAVGSELDQDGGPGPLDQDMVNLANANLNEYGDPGLRPLDLPGTTVTLTPDTTQVSSTNITLDVPSGDINATDASGAIATVIWFGTAWVVRAFCYAAFIGQTSGGVLVLPPALLWVHRTCSAIASGIAMVAFWVAAKGFGCGWTPACFGDRWFIATTLASTAAAVLLSYFGVSETKALVFLGSWLRRGLGWIGGKLYSVISSLGRWISNPTATAASVRDWFNDLGDKIALAWRNGLAQATNQNPPLPLFNINPGAGGSTGLRPMAMGDSITDGWKSSDGAGYRCLLQSYLDDSGMGYRFVGSLNKGSCTDEVFPNGGTFWPQNEGHSGWKIADIADIESCTIRGYEPNVVFLDIGTNDVNGGGDPHAAATAEENLINSIYADDANVVVVVGGLIPTGTYAGNMATFNSDVSTWISQHPSGANGGHVIYADMSPVRSFDLADGLHPNDAGYDKMATPWLQALTQAGANGWISGPNAGTGCSFFSPPHWYYKGTVATGPGYNAMALPGNVVTGLGDQVVFTDMNGDGKDDLVVIGEADGSLQVWLNGGQTASGSVTWLAQPGQIAPVIGGDAGYHIRLADINGDAKADYLDVADNGSVKAWTNGGARSGGGWNWTFAGTIATGVGANGTQISFADMDGDKKADYLVTSGTNGQVQMWRNGGSGCGGWCWYPKGTIASGGNSAHPVFPDLNADGLADYADINSDASVTAWINPGLANLSNGIGWISKGQIACCVGYTATNTRFGDINGDGKDDYLDDGQGTNLLAIHEWQNDQPTSGATSGWAWSNKGTISQGGYSYRVVFAIGALSADPAQGTRADYWVIKSDNSGQGWVNGGEQPCQQPCSGSWGWYGPYSWSPSNDLSSELQLADLNGDGYADALLVNKSTGAVTAYPGHAVAGTWGTVATGVGAPGSQIRFGDMNGDGKADYINLKPNGSMDVWLNGGQGCGGWCWYPQGTIATGVGDTSSHIRLADINGDRKADYIDVADNSSATLWLNGGPGCGGWCWYPQGSIASGVGDPGSWIQFADLDGDKKADYLSVNPVNGATRAWIN